MGKLSLWSTVVLAVGMTVARAFIVAGLWFAKKGDRIGNVVLRYVGRAGQGQQPAREHDQGEDEKTPDERHGKGEIS